MTPRPLFVCGARGRRDDSSLVALVDWVERHDGLPCDVLSWASGPPEGLSATTRVRLTDTVERWWLPRLAAALGSRTAARALKSARLRAWMWKRRDAPVIYCTDPGSARIVGWLPARHPRVVTAVPPGEGSLGSLTPRDRRLVVRQTDRFLAHDTTDQGLLVQAGVERSRVRLLAVPFGGEPMSPDLDEIRAQLGVPADATTVVSTGAQDWWSAPELFPVIAWRMQQLLPNVSLHFLWLTDATEREQWPFLFDVAHVGLDGQVQCLPTTTASASVLAADLVLVASRDPGARALMIEAVKAQVPVVVTDNHAVPQDRQTATVVPYLDLDAIARAGAGELRAASMHDRRSTLERRRSERRAEIDGALTALAVELGVHP